MAISATYVSATQFTVSGDLTTIFVTDIRVRVDCGGWVYSSVASSSYSAPNTTVTLRQSVLTDPCGNVEIAPYSPQGINIHDHSGDDEGGSDVVGLPPEHGWNGTQLRFKNPDGTWGSYVDLGLGAAITQTGTAGENLAQYDIVYSDTADSGKWKKALSGGTQAQAEAWAIVTESGGILSGSTGDIVLIGKVENASWTWTPGAKLYLSSTSGEMTETKPSTGYVRPVGHAINATQIYFLSIPHTPSLRELSDVSDGVTNSGATGDILVRGASEYDRLAKGNFPQALTVNQGGSIAWADVVHAVSGTAGEALSQYDVIYTDTSDSGKWKKAQNDGTEAEADMWGLCLDSGVVLDATFDVLLVGKVTNAGWSWTPGAKLYLSDTAGGLTETEPSGGYVRPVGHAISATTIWFFPAGSGAGGLEATEDITAGEALSEFDVVYLDTGDSGEAKKAKCNGTAAQADAIGIVTESGGISDTASGEITYFGPVENAGWSWTPGAWLYVSETAGSLTETKPTTTSYFVKPFAWAVSATKIIVAPQAGWEVSPSIYTVSGPLAATIVQGRIEYSSASELVYTFEKGMSLGLWDGSDVKLHTPSSDIALANTDNDIDGVALAVSSLYDIFAEVDASGSVVLSAKKWSSSTAGSSSRGYTLYQWQDMLVHENSDAGRKRRYLGTIYMYDNLGTAEFKDDEQYALVWNKYNRKNRVVWSRNTLSGTWNYATNTWREANAGTNTERGYVAMGEDADVTALLSAQMQSTGNQGRMGLGLNSTTAPSGNSLEESFTSGGRATLGTSFRQSVSGGYNWITLVETAPDGATITWAGYSHCRVILEYEG